MTNACVDIYINSIMTNYGNFANQALIAVDGKLEETTAILEGIYRQYIKHCILERVPEVMLTLHNIYFWSSPSI